MNQLELLPNHNVSYMLPYMNDEFPMHPMVAEFLESRPSWEQMMEVQQWMQDNMPAPDEKIVDHYFSEGTYTRSLAIPGGTLAIGKRHAKGHITMLMRGDVTIITEQGQERVRGPRVWVDGPGVKRAVYTHADSLWVTVHATDKTELSEIEAELIVPEVRLLEENTA